MLLNLILRFERYVNFEFYKTITALALSVALFERYVNFELYKTGHTPARFRECLRDM